MVQNLGNMLWLFSHSCDKFIQLPASYWRYNDKYDKHGPYLIEVMKVETIENHNEMINDVRG